ncbi:hypothetical protein ES288_D07G016400v1 [Gossypium darwinii]|uniref:S-methyl-5-thioribose-1-phosphate isomerase n=1 Tax=Gossypium darwinii TaxID=34276 RepID=A0A5D2BUM7_GOSDA|nr:hypothetical protein ES288_D07G016400v1 [Gossypium darwinii]
MVVRGAPAIAIAAALSLAVEVANFKDFNGTSEEAASFIELKLEYLVSRYYFQYLHAYIEAAEIMLDDDVASNKAIGSYGSRFLQDQRKIVPRFSVLTHCNTGSLATAGYGTALGVICALHAEGVLERAYCTETRPFNQSSECCYCWSRSCSSKRNLTDFIRCDTANKIRTYSLALCAMHHHIPFYVAASLSSIDLSLSSGEEIVIEERSAKELLHSRGGLGEQVASSGILVWNPAFDVTPAYLITGIITEKGVITKNNDAFNIKDFVEKAAGKSTA